MLEKGMGRRMAQRKHAMSLAGRANIQPETTGENTGTRDGSRTHHLSLSKTARFPLRSTGKRNPPYIFMVRDRHGKCRFHALKSRTALKLLPLSIALFDRIPLRLSFVKCF